MSPSGENPYVTPLRDPKGFLRGWRLVALLGGVAALGAIAFGLEVALRREEPPGIIPPERREVSGRARWKFSFPD